MIWEYSEDNLIEQTAIDIFFHRLVGIHCWLITKKALVRAVRLVGWISVKW